MNRHSCEHDYDRWAWPIGQAKIRRCRRCGHLQSWEEYLRWMKGHARPARKGATVIRRYLAVIQDARGYPPPGAPLDKAPPDGPEQPMIYSVVKAEEHEAEVERLRAVCDSRAEEREEAQARSLASYERLLNVAQERDELRDVLRDVVECVSSGRRDTIGRHEVYTAQIDVSAVERWRNVPPQSDQQATPDQPGEGESR